MVCTGAVGVRGAWCVVRGLSSLASTTTFPRCIKSQVPKSTSGSSSSPPVAPFSAALIAPVNCSHMPPAADLNTCISVLATKQNIFLLLIFCFRQSKKGEREGESARDKRGDGREMGSTVNGRPKYFALGKEERYREGCIAREGVNMLGGRVSQYRS